MTTTPTAAELGRVATDERRGSVTLQQFRKLKHRDFTNGAVLDEIECVFERVAALEKACRAVLDEQETHPPASPRHLPASIMSALRLALK